MRRLSAVFVLSLVVAARALGQFPPARLTNLKVFPGTISVDALVDTMAGFTRALGVRCGYCHVSKDPADLATFDFASDAKETKRKARVMLAMVAAINRDYLGRLPARTTPEINVACMTCHHGVPQPRPIQQIVLTAYRAGGADSAEAVYRALRQRYLGGFAYDFGEVPLVDVGDVLRDDNRLKDALRFYVLNTGFLPGSGFAFRSAAGAQAAVGDTTAAVASLERALAINPNDRQAQSTLAQLRPKSERPARP